MRALIPNKVEFLKQMPSFLLSFLFYFILTGVFSVFASPFPIYERIPVAHNGTDDLYIKLKWTESLGGYSYGDIKVVKNGSIVFYCPSIGWHSQQMACPFIVPQDGSFYEIMEATLPLQVGDSINTEIRFIYTFPDGRTALHWEGGDPIYTKLAFTPTPTPILPPMIITPRLLDATTGEMYSQIIQASAGIMPYGWSIINGSLPSGLSLDGSTGEIFGTPVQAGNFSFTVQVLDSNSQTASQTFSLTVNPAPSVNYVRTPVGSTILSPVAFQVTANSADALRLGDPNCYKVRISVFYNGWANRYNSPDFVINEHPTGFTTQINLPAGNYDGVKLDARLPNDVFNCWSRIYTQGRKDLESTFSVIHGNTPTGTNVSVGPLSGVILTFSQVTGEGQTTIASSSSGPIPPSGFKLGNPPTYYSISTTARFNPPVTVCISYNETQFKNEKNLKLFHFENGAWSNVTTSLDTANNVICGNVSSFSEFALLENISTDHLIGEVKSFNLKPDVEQGLLDKLIAAKSAIERNQKKTAVNIFKAFTNQVRAQKGKALTNEQANLLTTDAQALINSLGGNLLSTIFKWVFFGWLDKFVSAMLSVKI